MWMWTETWDTQASLSSTMCICNEDHHPVTRYSLTTNTSAPSDFFNAPDLFEYSILFRKTSWLTLLEGKEISNVLFCTGMLHAYSIIPIKVLLYLMKFKFILNMYIKDMICLGNNVNQLPGELSVSLIGWHLCERSCGDSWLIYYTSVTLQISRCDQWTEQ